MELFYTTSAGYDTEQTKPYKSLGGYKSSTVVSNDEFSNLFDEITAYTINLDRAEHIALIQKNTDGTGYTNVDIWIDPPANPYSTLFIGTQVLTPDAEGNGTTEQIRDKYIKPFRVDFQVHDSSNKLNIGAFADGEEIAIWVRRELDITAIKADQFNFYERDPSNIHMYIEKELEQSDTFVLNIEFT